MFLNFLRNWLKYRTAKVMHESHCFYTIDVPEVPMGFYAVVTVELKPMDSLPVDHKLEMAVSV